MIGCENVCGKCEACEPIVWAIKYAIEHEKWAIDFAKSPDDDTDCRAEQNATRATIDQSALVNLLARALRGRCVDGRVGFDDTQALRIGTVSVVLFVENGKLHAEIWQDGKRRTWDGDARRGRSAIARLLDAGLCSADEAMRLLDAA